MKNKYDCSSRQCSTSEYPEPFDELLTQNILVIVNIKIHIDTVLDLYNDIRAYNRIINFTVYEAKFYFQLLLKNKLQQLYT